MKIIDASNLVLGRASGAIVKLLLDGERVVVVNAEKAVITGRKEEIFERYKAKRDRGSVRKGPFYPKMPDRIFRRTVRGMLPFKKPTGRSAYRKLMVYIDVPDKYKDQEFETIPEAKNTHLTGYVTVGDVAKHLGWKGVGK